MVFMAQLMQQTYVTLVIVYIWHFMKIANSNMPNQPKVKNKQILSPRYFYRPQRSCGKVMFSQASVILFAGGVSQHALGQNPPPDRHPPVKHRPHLGRQHRPPPPTTTAADGTHPTGIHSFVINSFFKSREKDLVS